MSNRVDATAVTDEGTTRAELVHSRQYVYNAGSLAWERMTQPGAGGGGGGATTIVDGGDIAQGATTDLSSASTVVGILKAIKAAVQGTLTVATHAVTQSGTWTVQPGNTPNTTAWKVDGSAVTQPVSGTFWQATQPVSGTFWQATQPVSIAATVNVAGPLTDTQLRASAVPVSGAFFQATQPVSGTFWQATQPVSGPLTDTQLRASAVPVSGTFFQATQPVSIAATVAVTAPTLTKGTQGANGFSVQELKDAGRNQTNYFHAAPIITTVAEVMQTLTGYKGGIAVAATATPAVVTAGKTYRISRVTIAYTAATVIGGALIRLRANLTGAGVIGSPLVTTWQVGMPAVFTAGAEQTYVFDYPEGLEFPAGTGIAVGVIGAGAVPTTGTITGYVLLSIEGYEY